MTPPLAGRTVALAEGRQLEELAALLEAEGASTLRCPLLSILDAPDPAPVEAWIGRLVTGEFDLVILFTGEAVRRLTGFAERSGRREAFVEALGRSNLLCRGPKPMKALRELGVDVGRTAYAPTTAGVIVTLGQENLAGKRVGVTLYGSDNPELEAYLRTAGAEVVTVMPYVFAPAADDERVASLVARMNAGEIDVFVLTSSPQVDRLWEVAEKRGLLETLAAGLARTRVAAVGPLVADALRQRGAPVHVVPDQGWVMKNLVRQIVKAVSGGA